MKRILITCLLLLIVIVPAAAKGPFDRVIIEGMSLTSPIEVTDVQQLGALGMTELMVIFDHAQAPADPGIGYTLTRYGLRGTEYVPFDRVVYYPNPSDSAPLIFYEGLVNGGSEFDGHWFQAKPEGDSTLREILADHGITAGGDSATNPPLVEAIGFGDYYVYQILRDDEDCHVTTRGDFRLAENHYAAYLVACSASTHLLVYHDNPLQIPLLYLTSPRPTF